jgi:hypothetical protein
LFIFLLISRKLIVVAGAAGSDTCSSVQFKFGTSAWLTGYYWPGSGSSEDENVSLANEEEVKSLEEEGQGEHGEASLVNPKSSPVDGAVDSPTKERKGKVDAPSPNGARQGSRFFVVVIVLFTYILGF